MHAASPVDDRIDAVCDGFEQAWAAGQPPDLAPFLTQVDDGQRGSLLRELILLDVDYRRRFALPEDRAAYAAFSPDGVVDVDTHANAAASDLTTPTAVRRTGPLPARGSVIGRFELSERIGGGGGGEVWKAYDPGLQRDVAIKMAHPQTDDELHRFVREGRAVAQLRHPHIVAVHDAWCADGVAYLVSDYYEGADLKQRLACERLSGSQAAELCATLADALHYAHDCGVIHRDLKPANILLDRSGRAHIADFGLAKWEQDAREVTLAGQLLGTVAYMSPEQARGDAVHVDRRSDVYALGAILYEMLTGSCPFAGDQASVLHAITNETPVRPRSVNGAIAKDLETICLKAMSREASHRYATAGEMAADLRRHLRGEPIRARRRSIPSVAWAYIRRRPTLAIASILAVVAAAALVSAQGLRAQNRELLGLRTVSLSTKPPGARIVFVPLSRSTRDPQPSQLVEAAGRSPVEQELAPGDYMVVAALNDGRFHEVYRHVPAHGEVRNVQRASDSWSLNVDGGVDLMPISIPDATVTDGMVLVEFKSPEHASFSERRRGRASVQPFWIDPLEFSTADWTRWMREVNKDAEYTPRWPPDSSALVTCGGAAWMLECLGKRLPSAAEYEFAATAGGTQRYPWGNQPPAVAVAHSGDGQSSSDKVQSFDKLDGIPRIRGLCTGAAEWTTSIAPNQDGDGHAVLPNKASGASWSRRIVKGLGNNAVAPAESLDPRAIRQLDLDDPASVAGFRGYRSARPHLSAADFDVVPGVAP
jgi:serine/threonine protein kinase/formylglycine-generating enzyme required for sulfatase activity